MDKDKGFIASEDASDVTVWSLPEVSAIKENIHSFVKKKIEKFEFSQEELDSLKANAEKEGFDAGYQQGEQLVQEQLKNLVALMIELEKPLQQIDEEVEKSLVDLVKKMVSQIVHEEIKISEEFILTILQESLQSLPVAENKLSITCHPKDAELIENHLKNNNNENHDWCIESDENISPGGCELQTEHSAVCNSIESRIAEVIERVLPEMANVESNNE